MESKNESIQLTRICITTTFPVGEKSIFFQKPLQGRFPTRLFLYCTQMSIAKIQKNPVYCHSHPGLAVRHMCLCQIFSSQHQFEVKQVLQLKLKNSYLYQYCFSVFCLKFSKGLIIGARFASDVNIFKLYLIWDQSDIFTSICLGTRAILRKTIMIEMRVF